MAKTEREMREKWARRFELIRLPNDAAHRHRPVSLTRRVACMDQDLVLACYIPHRHSAVMYTAHMQRAKNKTMWKKTRRIEIEQSANETE